MRYNPHVLFRLKRLYNSRDIIARGVRMNLQAIGIIAEYNPFHNGHRWQLQTLRERFGNIPVVVCMSGWFVQRGETALADPWTRAAIAVRSGADLVLLLPTWFSLRSADFFAAGAVKTLAGAGIVDLLACSAEYKAAETSPTETGCPASTLSDTAAWTLQADTEQQIKTLLQQGLSYAAAWETAASQSHIDTSWFTGANNLLALAYQKAILQNQLPIQLITLPRQGSAYNNTQLVPPYASASAIRTALQNGCQLSALVSVLPEDSVSSLELNESNYPARFARQEETLTLLLSNLLARYNSLDLYEHSSANKDLCDRFYNARLELQKGCSAFCRKIANKRDPLPSVRRLALQLLLQKSRAFWTEMPEPAYLRLLAFNDRGRSLLRKMKETAKLPIIIKPGNEEHYRQTRMYPLLQLDAIAADLFQLLNGNTGTYGTYFTTSPVYVK